MEREWKPTDPLREDLPPSQSGRGHGGWPPEDDELLLLDELDEIDEAPDSDDGDVM